MRGSKSHCYGVTEGREGGEESLLSAVRSVRGYRMVRRVY